MLYPCSVCEFSAAERAEIENACATPSGIPDGFDWAIPKDDIVEFDVTYVYDPEFRHKSKKSVNSFPAYVSDKSLIGKPFRPKLWEGRGRKYFEFDLLSTVKQPAREKGGKSFRIQRIRCRRNELKRVFG